MGKLNKLIFLGIFLVLVLGSVFAYDFYRVYTGGLKTRVPEHLECRDVYSSGSNVIFVPTATSTEWSEFRANYPPEVTVNSCLIPLKPNCYNPVHCVQNYRDCSETMRCLGGECCTFSQGPPPRECPSTSCGTAICSYNRDCDFEYPDCPVLMYCSNGECCANGQTNCPLACV
jgi:hypothetical protein